MKRKSAQERLKEQKDTVKGEGRLQTGQWGCKTPALIWPQTSHNIKPQRGKSILYSSWGPGGEGHLLNRNSCLLIKSLERNTPQRFVRNEWHPQQHPTAINKSAEAKEETEWV